jgi:HEAT repeat protein
MVYKPALPGWYPALFALALAMTGSDSNARAQATSTQTRPAPRSIAPGPESFARNPQTPLELWDAIDYLVRVGQPERALPYLNAFLKTKPDDATLLEIRDRFGAGSILRLGDHPSTERQARPLMELVAAASHRHSTQPERIKRFITLLTKTREEQDYGVARLREAGPYAVPWIVDALTHSNFSPTERALIVGNLGRLDFTAVPALVCVLDSSNSVLAADVASALGGIGDPRAVPYLTFYGAQGDALSPVRATARTTIQRITGKAFEAQSRSPIQVLTDEARRYWHHSVAFPADQVELWVWENDKPIPKRVSRSQAEEILGLRFARQAIQLDPSDNAAQVVFLSLALEKAAERTGLGTFPANDPDGLFASAVAVGPAVLGDVLRGALAEGHSELAVVAIQALARVTDRDALGVGQRLSPLVEALTAPDRRVQFAAAQALVALAPQKPFPGSSRVVPVLARFVTSQPVAKAVVIDTNPNRGGQIVGYLHALGYDAVLASSGDQGFRLATDSADVELIVIEPSLFHGPWRLIDTITNLRADARTTGIPIFLVGSLDLHERMRIHTTTFPRVALLVTPANPEVLKQQLDRNLARMGTRPLKPEERQAYAQAAATILAQVAARPGSPFETDLTAAEPALTIALNTPATGLSASTALGDMPAVDAQRVLADVLLDPSKPAPLRLSAAGQLTRSIQRFGPLVSSIQEQRLAQAFDQASEASLRIALAGVIGALRPRPESVGRRLESYGAAPGSIAPPPAPEPAVIQPSPPSPDPAAAATPAPAPGAEAGPTTPAAPGAEASPAPPPVADAPKEGQAL